MPITLILHESEVVIVAGAIKSQIESYEKHCLETDAQYRLLNNIVREQIDVLKEAHKTFLETLRANGYPMREQDIT